MNQKGVTLLELITVLVIIAIGALLTVPNIRPWMVNYRMRSATRDIVSTMRLAQVKAVAQNMRYGVAFDTANPDSLQIQIYRDSGGLTPDGGAINLPPGVAMAVTFPVEGGLGKPFVRFLPDSTASGDGTVSLTGYRAIPRTIQVSGATGKVKIQ